MLSKMCFKIFVQVTYRDLHKDHLPFNISSSVTLQSMEYILSSIFMTVWIP